MRIMKILFQSIFSPYLAASICQNLTTQKLNDFIHYKLSKGRLERKRRTYLTKSVRDIMTVYRSIENVCGKRVRI